MSIFVASGSGPSQPKPQLCAGSGKSPDKYPDWKDSGRLPCPVCGERILLSIRRLDHSRPEHLKFAEHPLLQGVQVTNSITKAELRVKIITHLMEPYHPQRAQCLMDLMDLGVLGNCDTISMYASIKSYLDANKRGFCQDGIQRFKDAIGLKPPAKTYTTQVLLTYTWTDKDNRQGVSGRRNSGGIVGRVRENIEQTSIDRARINEVHVQDFTTWEGSRMLNKDKIVKGLDQA